MGHGNRVRPDLSVGASLGRGGYCDGSGDRIDNCATRRSLHRRVGDPSASTHLSLGRRRHHPPWNARDLGPDGTSVPPSRSPSHEPAVEGVGVRKWAGGSPRRRDPGRGGMRGRWPVEPRIWSRHDVSAGRRGPTCPEGRDRPLRWHRRRGRRRCSVGLDQGWSPPCGSSHKHVTDEISLESAFDLDLGGDSLWVTNAYAGTLSRIDLEAERVIEPVDLGLVTPHCVDATASAVWVTGSGDDGGDEVRIDPATNDVVARIQIEPGEGTGGSGASWRTIDRSGSRAEAGATLSCGSTR